MARSIGPGLRQHWQRLATLPAGKRLFSHLLRQCVPYTGRPCATIEVLHQGHCVIKLWEQCD